MIRTHNPASSIRRVRLVAQAATLAALHDGLSARAAKEIGHYSATLLRAGASAGCAISRAESFARALRQGYPCPINGANS